MKSNSVHNKRRPLLENQEVGYRVLIVDLSKNFGGANTRVLNLMRHLPRETVALAALHNSPVALEAMRMGFKVFIVGKRKSNLQIATKLVSVIRSERIQLIDAQNPQSKFWASISAQITGIALVSTLNSWYANEHGAGSLRGVLYSILELATNFSLDRYIVVAKPIRSALVKWGIAANRIDVINNAVEPIPDLGSDNPLMKALNIPQEAIILVAVGRLTWAKGYEDLIQAIGLLKQDNAMVRCLIAGEGELHDKLAALVENKGLSEQICLLGHLPRESALALMAAGHIFVMPSKSEGTPIALLEAAMLRKPIVATKVGGIPDLLTNGDECLLVESGDVSQLADGIKRVIQDRALSKRLGDNAYRRVSLDFSLEAQATATITSYNRALESRNQRMS